MRLGVGLGSGSNQESPACQEDHIAFTCPEVYLGYMCKHIILFTREDDSRFIAEVQEIPGTLTYNATQAEAKAKGQAIALHALAELDQQNTRGNYGKQ